MLTKPFKNANRANVSQGFHPQHPAIDWVSKYGTPLVAPEDVKITQIVGPQEIVEGYDWLKRGYGVRMRGLETGNTYLFWHCFPYFPVWAGDRVKRGKLVAYMGNSGEVYSNGTYVPLEERTREPHKGTHLHLVMWDAAGNKVDPLPHINMMREPEYTIADELNGMWFTLVKIGKLLVRN